MQTIKRRSRREALAFFLSTEISDIHWYQPGRAKIPVMATDDAYYCATRGGEAPPKGWQWQKSGDAYHYVIHKAGTTGGGS